MSIQDNASDGMGFVDGLNDAIRKNPIAAGLLGAGVAWMMFSRTNVTGALKSAAGTVGAAAAAGGASAGAGLAAAGSQLAGAARQAKASVTGALTPAERGWDDTTGTDQSAQGGGLSQTVSGTFAHAADAVRDGVRSSAQSGMNYGASLKQTLSENLERQPLLLGAIGLAIGAGLASAFPTTEVEGDLMGASGSAARDKLQGLASEAKSRATQVLDDVKQEAQAQRLTPSAAKDALADVAERAKTVAGSARQSVSNRIS